MKLTIELMDGMGFGRVLCLDDRIVRSYVGVEYEGMSDVWVLFQGSDNDIGSYTFDARTERSFVEFLKWWFKTSEDDRDAAADEYAWLNKEVS